MKGIEVEHTEPRHIGMALFLLFLGLYVLTGSGRITSADGERVYQVTRSLATRGALDVPGYVVAPYRLIVPGYVEQKVDAQGVTAPDGRHYAAGGIGMPVLAVPFYLLGAALSLLPFGIPAEYLTRLGVSWLNPVAIACLWALLYRLTLCIWGRRVGLILALAGGVSTVLWPYAKNTFSEPVVAACLVAMLLFLDRFEGSGRPGHLALAGGCLSLALLVRFDMIVILPAVAIYVLLAVRRASGSALRSFLAWGLPLVVAGALSGACNWLRFGSPLQSGYQAGVTTFPTPLWEGLYGQLLSPMRGLLPFNPVLLVAALGWPLFVRRRPRLALLAAALALAHLFFYSKLGLWEGGSWGPRYLVSTLPLYLLPLGEVLSWKRGAGFVRLAVTAAFVLGLFVQTPNILSDEGRYVQHLYQTRDEAGFRETFYAGSVLESPIVGSWAMAQQVFGNYRTEAARRAVLQAAESKRTELSVAERPDDSATHGASETMALIAFNFPDFWFVQLLLLGAPGRLVALLAIPGATFLLIGLRRLQPYLKRNEALRIPGDGEAGGSGWQNQAHGV